MGAVLATVAGAYTSSGPYLFVPQQQVCHGQAEQHSWLVAAGLPEVLVLAATNRQHSVTKPACRICQHNHQSQAQHYSSRTVRRSCRRAGQACAFCSNCPCPLREAGSIAPTHNSTDTPLAARSAWHYKRVQQG